MYFNNRQEESILKGDVESWQNINTIFSHVVFVYFCFSFNTFLFFHCAWLNVMMIYNKTKVFIGGQILTFEMQGNFLNMFYSHKWMILKLSKAGKRLKSDMVCNEISPPRSCDVGMTSCMSH